MLAWIVKELLGLIACVVGVMVWFSVGVLFGLEGRGLIVFLFAGVAVGVVMSIIVSEKRRKRAQAFEEYGAPDDAAFAEELPFAATAADCTADAALLADMAQKYLDAGRPDVGESLQRTADVLWAASRAAPRPAGPEPDRE